MDEKKLARSYETRRDDTSSWETEPTKANVRHTGTVVFSVRFSPEELAFIRDKAEEKGITVSELIRGAAIREVTTALSTNVLVSFEELVPGYDFVAMGGETSPPPPCAPSPEPARAIELLLLASCA